MSDDATPRLDLPLLQGGQAQKHLTMNAALMRLESLVQAKASSRTTAAQPSSPVNGDTYILPASPTGTVWSGLAAGSFVRFDSGAWEVIPFPAGAVVYVADGNRFVVRTETGWAAFEDALKAFADVNQFGIGTGADSTNVLAVKGPAALLTAKYAADGGSGDLSLALNKEGDSDTAQILFQKAFSSRAILGLLGDNDLTVKMSTDGTTFVTALTVKPTGAVQVPAGAIIDSSGRAVLRAYTVSALPGSGIAAGTLAYASNGRMFNGAGALEGASAGSGGIVCWNGSAWKVAGTNQTVAA